MFWKEQKNDQNQGLSFDLGLDFSFLSMISMGSFVTWPKCVISIILCELKQLCSVKVIQKLICEFNFWFLSWMAWRNSWSSLAWIWHRTRSYSTFSWSSFDIRIGCATCMPAPARPSKSEGLTCGKRSLSMREIVITCNNVFPYQRHACCGKAIARPFRNQTHFKRISSI